MTWRDRSQRVQIGTKIVCSAFTIYFKCKLKRSQSTNRCGRGHHPLISDAALMRDQRHTNKKRENLWRSNRNNKEGNHIIDIWQRSKVTTDALFVFFTRRILVRNASPLNTYLIVNKARSSNLHFIWSFGFISNKGSAMKPVKMKRVASDWEHHLVIRMHLHLNDPNLRPLNKWDMKIFGVTAQPPSSFT